MKRVEFNPETGGLNLGDSIASETSNPRFVAGIGGKEQGSDKKATQEDSDIDEEYAPAKGAAAVPGKSRDAEPEEKVTGILAALNCCAPKKRK